jgi:hypothetical protein
MIERTIHVLLALGWLLANRWAIMLLVKHLTNEDIKFPAASWWFCWYFAVFTSLILAGGVTAIFNYIVFGNFGVRVS